MKFKLCTLTLATFLAGNLTAYASQTDANREIEQAEFSESISSAKAYDRTFIDELTEHHKEGVMMSEIAVRKAHHPELREMAEMMMKAQAKEIKIMAAWRKDWYPRASDFKSRSVGMNMEKLEALSGEEFDLAFLDSMIMHHPGAIYLSNEAQSRGYHRSLINLAKKISSDQFKELKDLRMWRYKWSNHDAEK